jgi:hypothetical protein
VKSVNLVISLPLEAFRHGVLILGAPGTGKSVLLKALRASIATEMSLSSDGIVVCDFDTKEDLYDIARLFPSNVPFYNLDPFVDGNPWNLAGEIDSPLAIKELANALIPNANQNQPYFSEMARYSWSQNLLGLWLRVKEKLTFRDMVLAGMSPNNIRKVARSSSLSESIVPLFQDTESGLSLAATSVHAMSRFAEAAALYSTSKGAPVTTRSILSRTRAVVRLPFNLKAAYTLGPLAALFAMMLQLRAMIESVKGRIIIFIWDELSLIPGGLDLTLSSIFGREAGVVNTLAFQSQATTAEKFGKDKLEALISLPKTIIALQQPHYKDAEDTARRFGNYQGFVKTWSHTYSKENSSTLGESLQTIENVTASDIMSLPVPAPGHPYIEGFMATIPFKPFRFKLSIPELVKTYIPKVERMAEPKARDPMVMILRPWDDADLDRLGLREYSGDAEVIAPPAPRRGR